MRPLSCRSSKSAQVEKQKAKRWIGFLKSKSEEEEAEEGRKRRRRSRSEHVRAMKSRTTAAAALVLLWASSLASASMALDDSNGREKYSLSSNGQNPKTRTITNVKRKLIDNLRCFGGGGDNIQSGPPFSLWRTPFSSVLCAIDRFGSRRGCLRSSSP